MMTDYVAYGSPQALLPIPDAKLKLNSNEKKVNCFEKSNYMSDLLTRKASMLRFNDRYNILTEKNTLLRKRNYEELLTNSSLKEYEVIQKILIPSPDKDVKMNESKNLDVLSEEELPDTERKYLEGEEGASPNEAASATTWAAAPPTTTISIDDELENLTGLFAQLDFQASFGDEIYDTFGQTLLEF